VATVVEKIEIRWGRFPTASSRPFGLNAIAVGCDWSLTPNGDPGDGVSAPVVGFIAKSKTSMFVPTASSPPRGLNAM
jgi:hypothetical protein